MTDKPKYEPHVMFSDIPNNLPELRKHLKDLEENYEMTSQIKNRVKNVKNFIEREERFEEFRTWCEQHAASGGKERPLAKSSLEDAKEYLAMLEKQPPSRAIETGINYVRDLIEYKMTREKKAKEKKSSAETKDEG